MRKNEIGFYLQSEMEKMKPHRAMSQVLSKDLPKLEERKEAKEKCKRKEGWFVSP